MMNTADRSLAMLDYVLRRRFAFYEMKPGFNTDGFRKYRSGLNNTRFDNLIRSVEQLNTVIAGDQGMMFGYVTNETPDLLPMPYVLATRLVNERDRS